MSSTHIYYLFTILTNFGFGATIVYYSIFLRSIGLSLSDIALINLFYGIVVVIAEVPTGMFADGRSRAWSLKTGIFFQGTGALAYMFAQGIVTATIAEMILAVGMSFTSGAKQAWIADALSREGKSEYLRHIFATDSIFGGLSILIGGVFGVALALVHIRVVWLPMFILCVVTWLMCMRFMNGQGEPLERIGEWLALKRSFVLLKKSRALIWLVSVMIVFSTTAVFFYYWSLYFCPQTNRLGLSTLWAILFIGQIVSGFFIRRIRIAQGRESIYIILSVFLAGVGLVLIPFMKDLFFSIFFVVVHEIGRGMFQPLTDSFVQHRIESSCRATFGSLQSLIGRIGYMVVPFIIWISIDGKPDTPLTIGVVWIISGAVLVVASIILWLCRPQN